MSAAHPDTPQPAPGTLLRTVRQALRIGHYSPRTEEAYTGWIRRFILFHGTRHPADMGAAEISAFLTHLACERHVRAFPTDSPSSSRHARSQRFSRRCAGRHA